MDAVTSGDHVLEAEHMVFGWISRTPGHVERFAVGPAEGTATGSLVPGTGGQ